MKHKIKHCPRPKNLAIVLRDDQAPAICMQSEALKTKLDQTDKTSVCLPSKNLHMFFLCGDSYSY